MQQFFPNSILYGGDYNPEQWSEDVWQEDMRLMKLANVNTLSINIFSWALLEPKPGYYQFDQLDRIMDMLQQHTIAADLATATASPPTWMSRIYPAMLPVTRNGERMSHGSRQHYCPNSPEYRRKAAELVQQLAERYASHPALKMWHINNEYGCHISECYCDNCAAAFRVWLQQRYATLDALNLAWGTNFWSQRYYDWIDIVPPRLTPTMHNPSQRLDYWRFMSDSLLGCYQLEADILRRATPNIPLTTNFMPGFKPIDGFSWAPHLDIASFDMYPANTDSRWATALQHDLMRSLKGQPHLIMELSTSQVNWMPQNPQKRPGRMRLHILQGIAHGANGAMFFQWRQSKAGAEKFHAAMVPHDGNEHGRVFQQVAQVGAELHRLAPEVAASNVHAQVALLMDWQNWWDIEYLPRPSDRLHYWEQLNTYYRELHRLNLSVDIVASTSDLSTYKLVIAPSLHLLRPGAAQNMEQFVERGGTLLTTFFSGIADENSHITTSGYPGPLRKLLGIYVEEIDPWTAKMTNMVKVNEGALQGEYPCTLWGEYIHLEGAQALGVFAHDYYADQPALTVHQFGQGHAYYLATQPDSELLAKLTQQLCHDAHVDPVLTSPEGVEVTKRVRSDGRSLYFLLNHTEQPQRLTLPAGTYTSLLDGKSVSGEVEIAAVDAMILSTDQ